MGFSAVAKVGFYLVIGQKLTPMDGVKKS